MICFMGFIPEHSNKTCFYSHIIAGVLGQILNFNNLVIWVLNICKTRDNVIYSKI